MLWSKAIQLWTAVRRRFHRQVAERLSQQQARFLTCVPQNCSGKRKNYSNSRATRGTCVEILNKSTAFQRALEFNGTQEQFKSVQQRQTRSIFKGLFKVFHRPSPVPCLWFVAGSMWLTSRTQSHSPCWGLDDKKRESLLSFFLAYFLLLIVPLATESKILG